MILTSNDLKVSAVFEGITFDGTAGDHDYVLEELTGWNGWETTQNTVVRPFDHGVFPSKTFVRGRQLILVGFCAKAQLRDELMSRLSAALAPEDGGGQRRRIKVDWQGRELTCFVYVTRFEAIERQDDYVAGFFRFKIEFFSPDGLKYGPALYRYAYPAQFSGGLVYPLYEPSGSYLSYGVVGQSNIAAVSNPGSARAYPTFYVKGEARSGFRITEVSTSRAWEFPGPLYVGQTITIFNRTGEAYLDGASVTSYMVERAAMSIGKSSEQRYRFEAAGVSDDTVPSLTVELEPAWW